MDEMPTEESPAAPIVAPEAPAPGSRPDYYAPGQNLVELCEQAKAGYCKGAARIVTSNQKRDHDGAEKYRKKRKKFLDMFAGEIPGKIDENDDITFVHLPYVTKTVLQFHAKYQRNYFPSVGDFVGAHSDRPSDQIRMVKTTRHLNLQLRKDVPEYIPENDTAGVGHLLFGSIFDVWYWNPVEERPVIEFISSDDFDVPYSSRLGRPDMAHIKRKCWSKRQGRNEIEAWTDTGFYVDRLAKLFPQEYGEFGEINARAVPQEGTEVRDENDRVQGIEAPTDEPDGQRVLLECDMWMVLPGQRRQSYVTIIVDKETSEVLRIALCTKDDPRDRRRWQDESAVFGAHVETITAERAAQYQQALDAYQEALAMGTIGPETPPPPEPLPLTEADTGPAPAPIRQIPWNRFTHYGCIPNPEGFYCWGLGFLIAPYNQVADDVVSRYITSYSRSINPTLFYSRQAKNNRGELEMKMGDANETPLAPEQLQKAFFQLQFPPPDPNAFKFEERMAASVQEISADDIIGGAPGKSGETATTSKIRASNAMDPIAVIGARYTRARTASLQNLIYINSMTLRPTDLHKKGLPGEDPEFFTVTKEDYEDDFDIEWTADPNLASRPQKEQAATTALEAIAQIPKDLFADPNDFRQLYASALENVFMAMDKPDIAARIRAAAAKPMPQPPAVTQGDPNAPNGQQPPAGPGGGNQPPQPVAQ